MSDQHAAQGQPPFSAEGTPSAKGTEAAKSKQTPKGREFANRLGLPTASGNGHQASASTTTATGQQAGDPREQS
jgi:hypothetical protein